MNEWLRVAVPNSWKLDEPFLTITSNNEVFLNPDLDLSQPISLKTEYLLALRAIIDETLKQKES